MNKRIIRSCVATLLAALFLPVSHSAFAVEFGVFGDINFQITDEPGNNGAFALGGLDIYASQKISDNTRALIEYVIEDGGDGFVVDLERLWVQYTFSNSFEVGVGRFHTPLGHWNDNYHHGALLYDTVSRPFFLEFEDGAAGVLPVHFVGGWVAGKMPVGNGGLRVKAGIGNGPSINTAAGFDPAIADKPEIEINNVSDPNVNKSVVIRAAYDAGALPLEVGVFAMKHSIAESGNSGVAAMGATLVSQAIFGADLRYAGPVMDIIGEYYRWRDENKVGAAGTYSADAAYLQFGYRYSEKLLPYYRYETLDFDGSDSYFRLLGTRNENRHLLGARYKLDEGNTLKLEVGQINPQNQPAGSDDSYSALNMQWSFLLF